MDLQYSESRACPSEPRLMSLAEIGAPVVDVLDPRSGVREQETVEDISGFSDTTVLDPSPAAIREMHALSLQRMNLALTDEELNSALTMAMEDEAMDLTSLEEVGVGMIMAHAHLGNRNAHEIVLLLERVLLDKSRLAQLAAHAQLTVAHRDKCRRVLADHSRMDVLAGEAHEAYVCGDSVTGAKLEAEILRIFDMAFPLACELLHASTAARRG